MKYSEIPKLRKHYEDVLESSVQEIAKLKKEIEESKAAIGEAEKRAKEAARKADTETYLREKNIVTMHEQRIEMHKVKIVDLEYKHLIDTQEFLRVLREVLELQNELTNGQAEQFMYHVEALKKIASEHEVQMSTCDRFANFVQTKVYRKLDSSGEEVAHRTNSGFYGMRTIVKMLEEPNHAWSIDMGYIQKAAAKALKARTLRERGGMDRKADQIMKS